MTSGGDYHEHLSKMMRTPSILPDVPHYPNVHKAFNRSKVAGSDQGDIENANDVKQPKSPKSHSHNKTSKHSPQFQEKVEVIEDKEKAEVPGESVDSKADGFIQQRHQKFELCKWATFKVH